MLTEVDLLMNNTDHAVKGTDNVTNRLSEEVRALTTESLDNLVTISDREEGGKVFKALFVLVFSEEAQQSGIGGSKDGDDH